MFRRWLNDDRGATAIEYALLAAIMAVAAITGLTMLGTGTQGLWTKVGDAFTRHL